MRGTLVDSNVILDLVTDDPVWAPWSAAALEKSADRGPLFINPIIYAEVSIGFNTLEEVESALPASAFRCLPISPEVAFLTRKAFLCHRRGGGRQESTLPDFFIGAHAAIEGLLLLTRDASRYRSYFPTVNLLAPDASESVPKNR